LKLKNRERIRLNEDSRNQLLDQEERERLERNKLKNKTLGGGMEGSEKKAANRSVGVL
jgi:hypothetical protein